MSQSRQLAAIMFTDIVGYTALMGNDEQKAFLILTQNRSLQKPIIEQFNGRWVKELGDGVMASFNTVSDAVLAAVKIQEGCKVAKDFQLRIGIHLGEVIFENDDVFGDGVNIASRIQSAAKPGSIYVSETVHNNVANKKNILTRFVKEETLKNVREPVKIFEIMTNEDSNNVIENHNKNTHRNSIAVLPFTNMSSDPEQEYFSDGMAEEILNSLAHIKDLKVAGRTSSFQFKGKNVDIREVGEKLNVNTVLEGSVRKQGTRLRITLQLINVEDGYHLWSERYDRELIDIFSIQDEIALTITEKLKVSLLEKEKAIINKNPTDNHAAYDLYLKGRFYLNRRGAGTIKGLEYFKEAAAIDLDFSLAYTGMADAYAIIAFYCIMPPHEVMPKARQCAEKAIQLNASLVEAYTALAFIHVFYDWNWPEAKKQFQQIFELNPGYAPAHYWYSYYLSFVERDFDASIREAKKAADYLEPLVSISHHVLSMMLFSAGRFEEGLMESKLAVELDENSFPGYRGLALNLASLKRYDESIDALKRSIQLSARHPWPMVELCWVYYLSGNQTEVKKILDELVERSATQFQSGLFMSGAAYFSGNHDKAFEFMELAFEQRDGSLPSIQTWPLCSYIREDPRFIPFLKRMNFPE